MERDVVRMSAADTCFRWHPASPIPLTPRLRFVEPSRTSRPARIDLPPVATLLREWRDQKIEAAAELIREKLAVRIADALCNGTYDMESFWPLTEYRRRFGEKPL